MKRLSIIFVSILLVCFHSQAQGLKNLIKKYSSGKSGVQKLMNKTPGKQSLSNDDIVAGLKEALSVGSNNASKQLSNVDGFFTDAAIKVLMPAEALKAEKKLRSMGMGKLVDDAILAMNRAAEDASKSAAPIFVNAVKQMSIQDAVGILRGNDFAATDYLKGKTTASLTEAFRPVIETSLKKVDATKYWNAVFTAYNKFSTDKVNPDLSAYVTEKALYGIFHQLGKEEQKIRKDPMARTSDILKKVFSN
ncbi:MAG: DUF4197 domain-containing protein [Flavisolibacter sp.]